MEKIKSKQKGQPAAANKPALPADQEQVTPGNVNLFSVPTVNKPAKHEQAFTIFISMSNNLLQRKKQIQIYIKFLICFSVRRDLP